MLEREDLHSPAAIDEARQTLKRQRAQLDERLAELPGRDALERYRRELDEATAGDSGADRLKRLKRLRDLADDIDDDLDRLRRARVQAKESLAAARRAARDARAAPQADIDRLYRKYTDPAAVAGELAHYLLAPRVEAWVNSGWYWYGRLSPYLGGDGETAGAQSAPAVRRPGRVVVYPGAAARPDFLVRRVRLSGATDAGSLDGRVTDIAMPAGLWAEPARVHLEGSALAGLQRLRLDARIDRRRPGGAAARIDLDAAGADVSGLALGPDESLRSEAGRADFRVAGIVDDGELDLDLRATVRGTSFRAREGVEPVLREVAAALADAGRIEIGAHVGGTVEAPQLTLTSSLRDLLAPLLRQRLQRAASGFRDGLVQAVRERTGEPLAELEASMAQLTALEDQLTERQKGFERTLERVREILD